MVMSPAHETGGGRAKKASEVDVDTNASAEPKVGVTTRSGSRDAERSRGRTGSRGRSPVQPGRRSKSVPPGGDNIVLREQDNGVEIGAGVEPARVSEYALDPEPNNSVVVRGTSAQATEYVLSETEEAELERAAAAAAEQQFQEDRAREQWLQAEFERRTRAKKAARMAEYAAQVAAERAQKEQLDDQLAAIARIQLNEQLHAGAAAAAAAEARVQRPVAPQGGPVGMPIEFDDNVSINSFYAQ